MSAIIRLIFCINYGKCIQDVVEILKYSVFEESYLANCNFQNLIEINGTELYNISHRKRSEFND